MDEYLNQLELNRRRNKLSDGQKQDLQLLGMQ